MNELINKIKSNFTGEIILPDNKDYTATKDSYSVQGEPKIIFKPNSSNDVAIAIKFAQDNNLILSVRSGGHSIAGFSTNKDGVVIDMSNFNNIEIIDESKNIVRIGAGARWGEVAQKLKDKNLAISSGDTVSVGVGGLILGGGIGWMVRKYGYTIDSLVGAEIITAQGEILKLSKTQNPELFWAIRGGGGNFGVITHFEFEAKKESVVTFGNLIIDFVNLKGTLKKWRDYMRTADENLTSFFLLMPALFTGLPGAMIMFCYAGNKEQSSKSIEDLKKLGIVIAEDYSERHYSETLQEAHPPGGVNSVVKNLYAKNFTDEMIDLIADTFTKDGDRVIQIRSMTGAPQRVDPDVTAIAYRDAEIMMFCGTFTKIDETQENVARAIKVWEEIEKFGDGCYSNFSNINTEEELQRIYPEKTLNRLKEVKKKYDPKNLFNQNFNIKV